MIAEDGVDAEPRLETAELGGPGFVRHMLGDETVGGEIIAQDHDQVGVERLRGVDHLAHAGDAHIGAAGVQVGDDGDGQPVRGRPHRRRRPVIGDDKIGGGLGGGIGGRGRQHGGGARRALSRS